MATNKHWFWWNLPITNQMTVKCKETGEILADGVYYSDFFVNSLRGIAMASIVNGIVHIAEGPSVKYKDGSEYWFVDGLLHRTDGPCSTNTEEIIREERYEWAILGQVMTFRNWCLNLNKSKADELLLRLKYDIVEDDDVHTSEKY
jgi:hypothetical protein